MYVLTIFRYTPKYMYPERTFPNYLSGTGYVMSLDVASRLFKTALSTPLLHLEDVYITGVCAKRAGVRPVNHYGFSYIPRKLETCALREAITTHKITASTMYTVWAKINDSLLESGSSCSNRTAAKKSAAVNKIGRRIGYFLLKNRIINNRCVWNKVFFFIRTNKILEQLLSIDLNISFFEKPD